MYMCMSSNGHCSKMILFGFLFLKWFPTSVTRNIILLQDIFYTSARHQILFVTICPNMSELCPRCYDLQPIHLTHAKTRAHAHALFTCTRARTHTHTHTHTHTLRSKQQPESFMKALIDLQRLALHTFWCEIFGKHNHFIDFFQYLWFLLIYYEKLISSFFLLYAFFQSTDIIRKSQEI